MLYEFKIKDKSIKVASPYIKDNDELGFKYSSLTSLETYLNIKSGIYFIKINESKKIGIKIDKRSSTFKELNNIYKQLKKEIIDYSDRLKNNIEPLIILYDTTKNIFILATESMLEDNTGTLKYKNGLLVYLKKNGITLSIDEIENEISKKIDRNKLNKGESSLVIDYDYLNELLEKEG